MEAFADLKKSQAVLAAKVSDLTVRLERVESIVENLDVVPAATEIERTVSEQLCAERRTDLSLE